MLNKELERVFLTNCAFLPTESQHQVIIQLIDFLLSREQHTVFLLRGYAGTGKTSLIGALVKMLLFLERKVVLLAPTGRAAKVFSLYAEHQAYTIHRKIYRQKTFFGNSDGGVLNANLYQNTLFIVDEASMIANEGSSGAAEFGTGRLLDDLISYVYGGKGCRLILLGDAAQLPPVGETESPALSADMLELYGLTVFSGNLTQVVRQKETSGILWNATALRKLIMDDEVFEFPKIKCLGFPDVRVVSGEDLIETLEWAYNHYGLDQTIVVTRSNKRAQIYNQGIRARVLGREGELESGDQLLVVKNNYYWHDSSETKPMEFIANGDLAVVRRVRRERELYGFRFADVLFRFPDYDDIEMEVTVLMDTLNNDYPALSRADADRLFQGVWEDYPEITLKRERLKKIKSDPYYNALQVKYAYAVTCHKAQGGQWQSVFIDQGYMTDDMCSPDYFRWLYTAFTRATEQVYLVNWPETQLL